ncbi:hypothetical protein MTO96_032168 [Rhipicephalus appendiculatus]
MRVYIELCFVSTAKSCVCACIELCFVSTAKLGYMEGKETSEPAAMLPEVISATPETCSTETSRDAALTDGSQGTADGILVGPVKKHGGKCHECTICGRRFTRKQYLDNHQILHTGEKPHVCPMLPRVDKEFSCHLCPAIFECSSDMDQHVGVHIGERPHVCPVCQKHFAWENNLVLHMCRRHGGVKTSVTVLNNIGEPSLLNDLPSMLAPISASVDIKAELSSPATTPPPNRSDVDIKAEPCSPTTTLPPVMTSINIKAEPSSPTTKLPFILTLVDIKMEPSLSP